MILLTVLTTKQQWILLTGVKELVQHWVICHASLHIKSYGKFAIFETTIHCLYVKTLETEGACEVLNLFHKF